METENDDKKVVATLIATLIKSSAKFEHYSCSYNGLCFECRKNKITGETKFLMNWDLVNSGLLQFQESAISCQRSKYIGKWIKIDGIIKWQQK